MTRFLKSACGTYVNVKNVTSINISNKFLTNKFNVQLTTSELYGSLIYGCGDIKNKKYDFIFNTISEAEQFSELVINYDINKK